MQQLQQPLQKLQNKNVRRRKQKELEASAELTNVNNTPQPLDPKNFRVTILDVMFCAFDKFTMYYRVINCPICYMKPTLEKREITSIMHQKRRRTKEEIEEARVKRFYELTKYVRQNHRPVAVVRHR